MSILRFLKRSNVNLVLKNRILSSTFQEGMIFPIKLAQIFSYFPIYIGNNDEPIKFKWLYWRVFYAILSILMFFIELLLVIVYAFKHPINLVEIKVIVFHLQALVQAIMFFRLTYHWPTFVKEWSRVEFQMKSYKLNGNLRLRLTCLAAGIMFIAGVEHSLVNAYKLKRCFDQEPRMADSFRKFFAVMSYQHIFDVVEYSFGLGLLIQFLNLQRTFYWNYADVFVMLLGSALTYRMEQITKKIKDVSKIRVNDILVWKSLREDYTRLSELCSIVNKRISGILMICFFNDLYFVLIQLYSSLKPIESLVEKVYFYLSFGLLILRIFCMCYFGGAVFEEWRNIGFYLNTLPTQVYNQEIERLIQHTASWKLALSGKNFFSISRGLILQMAGAIVTYELVLIQFTKDDSS